MEIIALIISIIALVFAVIAFTKALKNKNITVKEIVKEVKIEKAPVEHPFIYDNKKMSYTLNGNLEVTGSVTCLKKGEYKNE